MDNPNQPNPQEPINSLPPQPSTLVVEPQQSFVPPTPPPAKSKKRIVILVVIALFLMTAGAAAWFVAGKKDKQNPNTQQTADSSQKPQVTETSGKCAFIPKQNYKENEGLYSTWQKNAKKVDFDVYLPCSFPNGSVLHELGIAGGDSDEVVNVFLSLEPESHFYVRALPSSIQPPTSCMGDSGSTFIKVVATKCTKAGDSKFGPVYKTSSGNLSLTIGNSLIIWDYPPYDDSGDVKPLLEIINSLQKVDPLKLEFYNG
jgi:hypothetical protein